MHKADKKYIKKIYNYYFNKNFDTREIKKHIPNLTNKEIENIVRKFPKKIRNKDFTDLEKRYLEYMYIHCNDVEKLCVYINSKKRVHKTVNINTFYQLKVKKDKRKRPNNSCITYNQEKEIIKKYNEGYNTYQLANMYNFKTQKSVSDVLKKNNVQIRHGSDSYNPNSFSFEKIDTEFKAYYLGILLTDGYITSNRNNVSVQMCDKDVIEFINENTNGNFQTIRKNNPNHKIMYRTSIYHTKYKKELSRLSIVENKSLILEGPKLFDDEKKFIPYILRGIIDGDGWIRKDGKEFFICSASQKFILWCKEQLENLGMENIHINFKNNNYNGAYYIRSSRNKNIKILKEKIYNKPFGMKRKYDLLK